MTQVFEIPIPVRNFCGILFGVFVAFQSEFLLAIPHEETTQCYVKKASSATLCKVVCFLLECFLQERSVLLEMEGRFTVQIVVLKFLATLARIVNLQDSLSGRQRNP